VGGRDNSAQRERPLPGLNFSDLLMSGMSGMLRLGGPVREVGREGGEVVQEVRVNVVNAGMRAPHAGCFTRFTVGQFFPPLGPERHINVIKLIMLAC